MSSEDRIETAIRNAWHDSKPRRPVRLWIVAGAVSCFISGALFNDLIFKVNDLSYALERAVDYTSRCKSITRSEQMRNVEARVGKSTKLFGARDYLIALDYVFDRLQVTECGPR